MRVFPTLIGLCLALGGPALLALSDRIWGEPEGLYGRLVQQAVLLAMLLGVLAIIIFWEKQPIASLGWQSVRLESVILGLGLAGFFILIFSPLAIAVLSLFQLNGFEEGLSKLLTLPVWYRLLAVILGGTTEEVLYRGYGIERLSELTGSDALGAAISTVAFGLAHVPMWGWGPAVTTVLSGSLMALFYLFTRDLAALIVAHIMTDMISIIVAPASLAKNDLKESR